jgi:hypothetical protein
MHQFTITDQGLKALKKKLIKRLIPIFATLLVIVAVVNFWTAGNAQSSQTILFAVFFIAIVVFSFFNNFKRQVKMLAGYRLTIDDDSVTREMQGMPLITIKKSEIREIVKTSSGTLAIIGDSKINAIGVPAEVENIDTLEEMLKSIKPLTHKRSMDWLQRFPFLIIVPVIAVIFICFSSENLFISTLGGLAFVGLLTWGFVVIQKSKNVEKRVKRLSFVALLPIICVSLGLILRLVAELSK